MSKGMDESDWRWRGEESNRRVLEGNSRPR